MVGVIAVGIECFESFGYGGGFGVFFSGDGGGSVGSF